MLDAVTDVVVRDGSTVCMRRAGGGDVAALLRFLESLSPQSLYYRFHGRPALTEARIRALIDVDGGEAVTLVAECGGRIVAFASYHRRDGASRRAEVAFAVADDAQGHGIGTRLLEHLAKSARAAGIDTFDAWVLGDNRQMLDVFRTSGFTETVEIDRGIWHVELSIAVTDRFTEQAAVRSQRAASASMRAFFEPRVVAVVGANRTRGKIGSEILHNLLGAGFTGTVVPVHPTAGEIAGLAAYRRVSDIPGPVDLAMIVVPAAEVLAAVDDCISKSVRAICVIKRGIQRVRRRGPRA
jgi:predicted CoA-binding protein/GNAT superfamily N-acetyltransferase